jgi:hypothetical protein
MMIILCSNRFHPLQPLATSRLILTLPPSCLSLPGSHQEAYFEGRSQARSRDWRSRASQGFLQAVARGEEACSQEEACRKEGCDCKEGCPQEEGKLKEL